MRKSLYLIVLLLLLLPGCREAYYANRILEDADSLIENKPDSALLLIRTLDPQRLNSRAAKARYALLYTQALDKCHVDMTTDSVIAPAMAYFAKHGSNTDRARTYYYMGRICDNAGKTAEAAQMMMEAHKYAEKAGETYLMGLIYNCRARLYQSQYSLDEALSMYKLADSCFTAVGHIDKAGRMSIQKARLYIVTGKHALARPELQRAYAIFDSLKNTQTVMQIASLYANQMRHEGGIPADSIKRFLHKNYNRYNAGKIPVADYPIWTLFYLQDGKIDSARYYAKMASAKHFDGRRQNGFLQLTCSIEEASGNYREALRIQKKSYHILDSIAESDKANLVQRIEEGYKNKELMHTNEILKLRSRVTLSIALSIIILGAFAFVEILRRRRRVIQRKVEEIAGYKDFIERLNDDYQNLQESHNQLALEIDNNSLADNQLLKVLENRLSGLQQLLDIAYSGACKPQHFYQEFRAYAATMNSNESAFSDLQYVINKRHFGIIEHLHQEHPSLTNSELNMLSMVLFGFSLDCMRLIFNHENVDSIYSRRTKIREKLNLTPRFGLDKFLKQEIEMLRAKDRSFGKTKH